MTLVFIFSHGIGQYHQGKDIRKSLCPTGFSHLFLSDRHIQILHINDKHKQKNNKQLFSKCLSKTTLITIIHKIYIKI